MARKTVFIYKSGNTVYWQETDKQPILPFIDSSAWTAIHLPTTLTSESTFFERDMLSETLYVSKNGKPPVVDKRVSRVPRIFVPPAPGEPVAATKDWTAIPPPKSANYYNKFEYSVAHGMEKIYLASMPNPTSLGTTSKKWNFYRGGGVPEKYEPSIPKRYNPKDNIGYPMINPKWIKRHAENVNREYGTYNGKTRSPKNFGGGGLAKAAIELNREMAQSTVGAEARTRVDFRRNPLILSEFMSQIDLWGEKDEHGNLIPYTGYYNIMRAAAAGDERAVAMQDRTWDQDDYVMPLIMKPGVMVSEDRIALLNKIGYDPQIESTEYQRAIHNDSEFFRERMMQGVIRHPGRYALFNELLDAVFIDKLMGKNPPLEQVMSALDGLYAMEKLNDPRTGKRLTVNQVAQLLRYKSEDSILQDWFGPPDTQKITLNYGDIKKSIPYYDDATGGPGIMPATMKWDLLYEDNMKVLLKEIVEMEDIAASAYGPRQKGASPNMKFKFKNRDDAVAMLEKLKRANIPLMRAYRVAAGRQFLSDSPYGKPNYGIFGSTQPEVADWRDSAEKTFLTDDIFNQAWYGIHLSEYQGLSMNSYKPRTQSPLPFMTGAPWYGSKDPSVILKSPAFEVDVQEAVSVIRGYSQKGQTARMVVPIMSPFNYRDYQLVTVDSSLARADLDSLEKAVTGQMLKFAELGIRPVIAAAVDYVDTTMTAIDTYTKKVIDKKFGFNVFEFADPYSKIRTRSKVVISKTVTNGEADMLALDFINPTHDIDHITAMKKWMSNEPRGDYYNYNEDIFNAFMSESQTMRFRKDDITNIRHVIYQTKDQSLIENPGTKIQLGSALAKYERQLKKFDLPEPTRMFDDKGHPGFTPPEIMTLGAFETYDKMARHAVGIIEQAKILRQNYFSVLEFKNSPFIGPPELKAQWDRILDLTQFELERKLSKAGKASNFSRHATPWKGIEIYDPRNEMHNNPRFWHSPVAAFGKPYYSQTRLDVRKNIDIQRGLGPGQSWILQSGARLNRPDYWPYEIGSYKAYSHPSGQSLEGPLLLADPARLYEPVQYFNHIHINQIPGTPGRKIPLAVGLDGTSIIANRSGKPGQIGDTSLQIFDPTMGTYIRNMRRDISTHDYDVPWHVKTEWERATEYRVHDSHRTNVTESNYMLSRIYREYAGYDAAVEALAQGMEAGDADPVTMETLAGKIDPTTLTSVKTMVERKKAREESWIRKTKEAIEWSKIKYPTLYAKYAEYLGDAQKRNEYGSYGYLITLNFMRAVMDTDKQNAKDIARLRKSMDRTERMHDDMMESHYNKAQWNAYVTARRIQVGEIQDAIKKIRKMIREMKKENADDDFDEESPSERYTRKRGSSAFGQPMHIPEATKVMAAGKKFELDYKQQLIAYASSRIHAPFMGNWDIIKHWTPTLNDLVWTFIPPSKYYGYIKLASDLQWMMKSKYSMTSAERYIGAMARGRAGLTKKPYRRKMRSMIWSTTWEN